jgi:acyl-CoA dehydrogenase
MTIDLDDDHLAFQKVCRSFVDEQIRPMTRHVEASRSVPSRLWSEMGRAGLLGLVIPESHGGSGAGSLAVAILAEELARASSGIAITPLVSAYMAAPHILAYGTSEQRDRYLPTIVSGEALAAIAVTEPGAGSDVASIVSKAAATEQGWRLSGSKAFITNAGLAEVMVLAARTDQSARHRGISTFLVPLDTPGVSVGAPLEKLGWRSSDTREVFLEDVEIPHAALLGEVNRGFYQIMSCFQLERIVLAAMGVGLGAATFWLGRFSEVVWLRNRPSGIGWRPWWSIWKRREP